MARPWRAVGRNVLRKEGLDKATGAARYIDDLTFTNLLYARTVRSTIPAGEIVSVSFGFDPAAFVIVDHRDIPGRNVVALIDDDQPCLAERHIRHAAEPILLIASPDPDALRAARVDIQYRSGTPHYDPCTSSVTFKEIAIDKGDGNCVAPTRETVSGATYPISRALYIYPNLGKAAENPTISQFVDFYLSDTGIANVGDVGYVPLPQAELDATRQAWDAANPN